MPSKSRAQAKFMKAAAHSRAFAKKAGIPQSVAKDYAKADRKAGIKHLPDEEEIGASNDIYVDNSTGNTDYLCSDLLCNYAIAVASTIPFDRATDHAANTCVGIS